MPDTIIIASPAGHLKITASLRGVQALSLTDEALSSGVPVHMQPWLRALNAYFEGRGDLRSIPVDPQGGTELQRAVWSALRNIPLGETISYTTLAERVDMPDAVRAVASACGKNPVGIVIPCHRVLAKDGGFGGYAWGLPVKQQLLELESAVSALKQAA